MKHLKKGNYSVWRLSSYKKAKHTTRIFEYWLKTIWVNVIIEEEIADNNSKNSTLIWAAAILGIGIVAVGVGFAVKKKTKTPWLSWCYYGKSTAAIDSSSSSAYNFTYSMQLCKSEDKIARNVERDSREREVWVWAYLFLHSGGADTHSVFWGIPGNPGGISSIAIFVYSGARRRKYVHSDLCLPQGSETPP